LTLAHTRYVSYARDVTHTYDDVTHTYDDVTHTYDDVTLAHTQYVSYARAKQSVLCHIRRSLLIHERAPTCVI